MRCEERWDRDIRCISPRVHGHQWTAAHIITYDQRNATSSLYPHDFLIEAASTTAQQDDLARYLGVVLYGLDDGMLSI